MIRLQRWIKKWKTYTKYIPYYAATIRSARVVPNNLIQNRTYGGRKCVCWKKLSQCRTKHSYIQRQIFPWTSKLLAEHPSKAFPKPYNTASMRSVWPYLLQESKNGVVLQMWDIKLQFRFLFSLIFHPVQDLYNTQIILSKGPKKLFSLKKWNKWQSRIA